MLHITPDMVELTYELLRATPPFKGWKLPHADEIEFHIAPMKGRDQADYHWNGRRHVIRVNPRKHHTLAALITTMAHEMIHMHEKLTCERWDVHHGRIFRKHATQVCRLHVLDRGQF